MKAKLCLLLCSLALGLASAQSPSFNQLFDATEESEDLLRLEISGAFFNLFASSDDDDDEPSALEGIKSVKLLGADSHDLISKASIVKMQRGLRSEAFEPLTEIRSDGDHIQFLIREKGKTITDFIAVVNGKDGVFMLSVSGEFSLDDVRNLNIDIEDNDKLKKAQEEIPRA